MKTSTKLDRAVNHLSRAIVTGGNVAHYDDGMQAWYVVTVAEAESLCDYLDDPDESVSADAYSHWCAGTVSRTATPEEVAEFEGEEFPTSEHVRTLRTEATEAGDYVMAADCDRALAGNPYALRTCRGAIADARAMEAT